MTPSEANLKEQIVLEKYWTIDEIWSELENGLYVQWRLRRKTCFTVAESKSPQIFISLGIYSPSSFGMRLFEYLLPR